MDKNYKQIADVVKADLERVNSNLSVDIELKPRLANELKKFLFAPSKRIRSLVAILYLRAGKMYLLPSHYELLSAVELVHNASLIHDDVVDDSDIRRNIQTLNKKFDNKLAVISGDYLLGLALKKLVKINSFEILDIFADTLQNMCKGEVNQYFNRFKKTKLDAYIEKTTQKTASLFESTIKSAVILAEVKDLQNASEFALNFGIAFQIRDDLLNFIKKDGTKTSNDEDDGIYNAPAILSDNPEKGIEKTRNLLNNYLENARKCIKHFPSSPYKTALEELLEFMKNV